MCGAAKRIDERISRGLVEAAARAFPDVWAGHGRGAGGGVVCLENVLADDGVTSEKLYDVPYKSIQGVSERCFGSLQKSQFSFPRTPTPSRVAYFLDALELAPQSPSHSDGECARRFHSGAVPETHKTLISYEDPNQVLLASERVAALRGHVADGTAGGVCRRLSDDHSRR